MCMYVCIAPSPSATLTAASTQGTNNNNSRRSRAARLIRPMVEAVLAHVAQQLNYPSTGMYLCWHVCMYASMCVLTSGPLLPTYRGLIGGALVLPHV